MLAQNKLQIGPGQSYEDYLINRGRQYDEKRQQEQAKKDMQDPESRECTFQPVTSNNADREFSPNKQPTSANKWEELYQAAERKRGGRDRDQDEIEFERNVHEMKFAPEIHEVNLRGTKNPIVAAKTNKAALAMRQRMAEKMDFLNTGAFGTLADAHGGDPGIVGQMGS